MSAEAESTGESRMDATADRALVEDLRLRLQGARAQENAARAEARLLVRELALARRLLQFFLGGPPPAPVTTAAAIQPIPAVLLTSVMRFHLDACEQTGGYTAICGWAFCPVEVWDGHAATVAVLLRHGATAYAATTGRVPRADVAVYFAAQTAEAGGARGLDGTGFACKIQNASLPVDVDLEIVLRLECAGMACERSTGQKLRL